MVYCLVVWNIFPYVGNVIIPTDFKPMIFQGVGQSPTYTEIISGSSSIHQAAKLDPWLRSQMRAQAGSFFESSYCSKWGSYGSFIYTCEVI